MVALSLTSTVLSRESSFLRKSYYPVVKDLRALRGNSEKVVGCQRSPRCATSPGLACLDSSHAVNRRWD